jgi:NAD(P)-dependent dehydrogenase (short-subunit alcohol dehydrogenase family)
MGKLDGKVALITGRSRHWPRRREADVPGLDQCSSTSDEEPSTARSRRSVKNARSPARQVTRPEDVERYVRSCVEHAGGIDVYLANAGVEAVKPIPGIPSRLRPVIAVNGVWLGLKHVIPRMVSGVGRS